jgi:hypothetical protein
MGLTTFQIVLIVSLVVVTAGGMWNMQRMKKKKAEEEAMMMQNYNNSNNENLSPEEQNAKNYIEQYKNTYPRDSIKQGLINAGNDPQKVEEWLNKYM